MTFGVSVGTLVLTIDLTFLGVATCFQCHSLRHLVGGKHRLFLVRAGGQDAVQDVERASRSSTSITARSSGSSLFTCGFADFYMWMVASGRIHDLRIF